MYYFNLVRKNNEHTKINNSNILSLRYDKVIYILPLKNDKWYVGKTTNAKLLDRIIIHYLCSNSAWIIKYPCIILKDRPIVFSTNCSDSDEDKIVYELMNVFGIDNVRGGSVSQNNLTNAQKEVINKFIYKDYKNPHIKDITVILLKLKFNCYYVGFYQKSKISEINYINTLFYIPWFNSKAKKYVVVERINYCSIFDVNKYVIIAMSKYGINNVRGGNITTNIIYYELYDYLLKCIQTIKDKCYYCDSIEHFSKNCSLK
jgi:hypothetical protein